MSDDDPTTESASEGTDRPATGRRRRPESTGNGHDQNVVTGSLPTLVLPTLVPPPRPPRMEEADPVFLLPDPTWADEAPGEPVDAVHDSEVQATPGVTSIQDPADPADRTGAPVVVDSPSPTEPADPTDDISAAVEPPQLVESPIEDDPGTSTPVDTADLSSPTVDPASPAPTSEDVIATEASTADTGPPATAEPTRDEQAVDPGSKAPAAAAATPAGIPPVEAPTPATGVPFAVTTPEGPAEPAPATRETWEGRDVSTEQPENAVGATGRHQVAPEVTASFEDTLPAFARIPSTLEAAATQPPPADPAPAAPAPAGPPWGRPAEPSDDEVTRRGAVPSGPAQDSGDFPLLTHRSVDEPVASSGPIADNAPEPQRRTDGLGREIQDRTAPGQPHAAPAHSDAPSAAPLQTAAPQPWSATQQPWSADPSAPQGRPTAGTPQSWPAAAPAAPPWPTRTAPPSSPQPSWPADPAGQAVGGTPQPPWPADPAGQAVGSNPQHPWHAPGAPSQQAWPNVQQPQPTPQQPVDEQFRTASPRLTDFLAQQAPPPELPATWGMRGVLTRMGLRMSPTSAELAHRQALSTIQRSLGGPKTIVVVNQKGGAGKTPATFLLAAVIGRVRGGFTLAWDNNENAGTLGWKGVGQERAATVVDLLGELDRFTHPELGRVGDLDNFVRSQGDDRFDLLASNQSTDHGTSQIGSGDFHAIHDAMSRYYRVLVVDTGNNDLAPNWQAALDAADQIVVPIRLGLDYAGGASRTLDVLDDIGHGDLVKGAVAIVSQSTDADKPDVRAHVRDHFGPRVRSIVDVPFDPALVEGRIVYDALRPGTRNAWIRAAAAVVSGL